MDDFKDYKLLILKELENVSSELGGIRTMLEESRNAHKSADLRLSKIENDYKWATRIFGVFYAFSISMFAVFGKTLWKKLVE